MISALRSALALVPLFVGSAHAAAEGYSIVDLGPDTLGTSLVRAKDGGVAFLVADERGLEVRPWRQGTGSTPFPRFERGESRMFAWCVAGTGENERVYVLDESRRIRAWNPASGETPVVLENVESMLPSGLYSLRFARDFDGDGAVDLSIPVAAGMQLYFGGPSGFTKGPRVDHRIGIDVAVSGYRDRNPSIRQSISIRDFTVEDQNGDGRPDLAFRDERVAEFYWSGPDGKIPEQPTFTVDLEKIKSALPKAKAGLIDTKNLLTVLDAKVSHVSRDVDGDGIEDLVLQKGRNVLVYRGTRDGVGLDKATAVLPTSGNLLAVALYDDDADGKLDLFMLHVGDVSLAQVLFWVVASGQLQLDLFVYRQDPAKSLTFARKPSSKRRVTISLPSLKTTVDKIKDASDALRSKLISVPAICDFDGDGARDDLAVLVDRKRIEVHPNVASDVDLDDPLSWIEVARRFDRDAKGSTEMTIDLEEVFAWVPLLGLELHDRAARVPPTWTFDLATTPLAEKGASAMFALDLDRDGKDDFVLLERDEENAPERLICVIPR